MAQVFFIQEENIRNAWLTALAKVLYEGDDIKTEYDNPDDLPSKDGTVLIEIIKPMSKPIERRGRKVTITSKFGNKYELYGCLADTYLVGSIQSGYLEEILEGINDHFLWESGLSFPYSYHDRLFNYAPFSLEDTVHTDYTIDFIKSKDVNKHQKIQKAEKIKKTDTSTVWKLNNGMELSLDNEISDQIGIDQLPLGILNFPRINQVQYIKEKLREKPFSRRAQAITWRPLIDPYHEDPPCLQRIWMRIKHGKLLMQTTWRSRDLLRAWEANVNGMVRIQKQIADALEVEMGHYVDFSNSLHIYGNTIPELKDLLVRMKNKGELPKMVLDLINKNS